jgi:nucleoside-diphosphate-sugar epimerase
MVRVNQLAEMVMNIAGKSLRIRNIPGPVGVRGRNSHNELIRKRLGWAPDEPLEVGLRKTYSWISEQVDRLRGRNHRAAA